MPQLSLLRVEAAKASEDGVSAIFSLSAAMGLCVIHQTNTATEPVLYQAAHQPAHATVHASCLGLQLAGSLRVHIEDHAFLVPCHVNHPPGYLEQLVYSPAHPVHKVGTERGTGSFPYFRFSKYII